MFLIKKNHSWVGNCD